MMALRALLSFSETSCRCFLTTVKYHEPRWQMINLSKNTRSFKNIRNSVDQTHSKFSNSLPEVTPPTLGKLWKPFGFAILIVTGVHVGAAVSEYERIRNYTNTIFNSNQWWHVHRTGWRGEIQRWWRSLSDGERVFVPICFLNILVFIAWRIPRFQTTMIHYFCANPASGAICWSMVLSTFSHNAWMHIATNMYVLYSFSSVAVSALGTEQFVALYVSSGVLSSFASHLYKTILSKPGLSLGASGAILGVVGFTCMQYPESQINIVFLPMFATTAGNAIKALLVFDAVGCISGWRFFDHASHLGGALWGIFWQTWGNSHIWQKRELVVNLWRKIRD